MKILLQIRLCIGKLFYKSVIWITIHSNTTFVKYTWWPNGHVIRQKSQTSCSAKKLLCWVTQNMMIFFLVLMVFLYIWIMIHVDTNLRKSDSDLSIFQILKACLGQLCQRGSKCIIWQRMVSFTFPFLVLILPIIARNGIRSRRFAYNFRRYGERGTEKKRWCLIVEPEVK